MNLPLYLTCLLAAQSPHELHFRYGDQGKLEVVAPLNLAQQKAIPLGKLTADQGEVWLRLCIIDPKTSKPGPPMLGAYRRDEAELVFRPRLGVEPGRHYRAYFGPGAGEAKDFRPAVRDGGSPPTVVKIYPTADLLPANHLKFYLYFSRPMRGGQDIFTQIDILDADGNIIPDAWLADELWDETGQILILYIHPGRIKWGVVLRDVLGPVLLPERNYTLVVRGAMADANGQKLGKDVTKKFRTSAEDRARVNVGAWKIQPPKAGTSAPLTVQFAKSLDHNALERFVIVVDARGNTMAGARTAGKDEKSLTFAPDRPWENQEYRLLIDRRLENVAGNTPLRPFDLDLRAPVPPAQRLDIPFRPRP